VSAGDKLSLRRHYRSCGKETSLLPKLL